MRVSVPPGFFFRPTDEQLLIHYLKRKSRALPLPCDIVFERDIYGVGDKAPWQIFNEEDPWTENTVYVLTRLIKVNKNGTRVARTAGCGSWVAETGPKNIKHNGAVIGSKKMLSYRINNDSVVKDKKGARKIHWIMHEYSLGDGKSSTGNGEYVLCKITNKSVEGVHNIVEASSADNDFIVPRPGKRVRTESVPQQKMDRDIVVEQETEDVPLLEDQALQEPIFKSSVDCDDIDSMFELEELIALLEEDAPVRLDETTVVEPQQGFSFDFDTFGDISSNTEVVPSGFASVPEMELPPKSFDVDRRQYLGLDEIFKWGEDLSNTESNEFLLPKTKFHATREPSLTSILSNNMHVDQLDPEITWPIQNISWPQVSFPQYGYKGEIDLLQNKEWSLQHSEQEINQRST